MRGERLFDPVVRRIEKALLSFYFAVNVLLNEWANTNRAQAGSCRTPVDEFYIG